MDTTNTQPRTLQIVFGAMSERIALQLSRQGVMLPDELTAKFQQDANDITRLTIRGLLMDAENRRARDRLFKQIVKEIRKHHPIRQAQGGLPV